MMNEETATQALQWLARSMNPMNRLKIMIGAYDFCIGADGVYFKFRMCRKANICKIGYNEGLDLFSMQFIKRGKTADKVVHDMGTIFCEDMKAHFEEFTGLYSSM
jgi:hypothetical protein